MPRLTNCITDKTRRLVKKNKHVHKVARKLKHALIPSSVDKAEIYDYLKFYPTKNQLSEQKNILHKFPQQPLISLIVPTYNTNTRFLKECIDSVIGQSYSNWELCIADDASPKKSVIKILADYAKQDKRIKFVVRETNGHISQASNSAIELANGEYLALLDHDDVLWPNALYEIVKVINSHENVDFIYTDEDKIDEDSNIHSYPFFKPDWSPEFLESCNYITHFACVNADVIRQVGGFRKGYEGAQDWDLFMRVSEKTSNILHISKVLYSWRVHQESTAQDTDAKPYVYEAQRKLLEDHIARSGKTGKVRTGLIWQHSVIEYDLDKNPSVDIVIYGDEKTFDESMPLAGYKNHNITRIKSSQNKLATALNHAVKQTNGDYILFASSNSKITSDNWLKLLLADGLKEGVAVVGGRKIDASGQILVSAGLGIGIDACYGDLLNGCSLEDNHYMRALHGKSRRNIAALNPPILVNRLFFERAGGFKSENSVLLFVDLQLSLLDMNYRNVYNPYVDIIDVSTDKISTQSRNEFKKKWQRYMVHDPYFNSNYSRENGRLEVK